MKQLRGICIGAGYFSRFQYEAWNRIPEVRIVAALNRTEERLIPIQQAYNIPRIAPLDELEKVLDEERPDFVDIITPPESHIELCRLIGSRGIHQIIQKPLAPTWEECLELREVVQNSGARALVHENWRWQPWYREIKRQIVAGAIGEVFSIAVRMRMGDGWAEDAYLARQPFFRTYPRLLVYETGVHFLDTFRYLMGEPESVYARLRRLNPAIKGEDSGQIVIGFANGATALLDASRYNEADTDDARYTFGTVRIDGSGGHLELGLDGSLDYKPLGKPVQRIDYEHSRRGFAGDCVCFLQRHFVDCILHEQPFESTVDDYLKTVAMVEACYRSHATGQVARV